MQPEAAAAAAARGGSARHKGRRAPAGVAPGIRSEVLRVWVSLPPHLHLQVCSDRRQPIDEIGPFPHGRMGHH
eukprot:SAG11_NODE_16521_length_545_cov_0.818386_1_plen_72_part_10